MKITEQQQKTFDRIELSFFTGIRSKKTVMAKNWLDKHRLSFTETGIGFNSGQVHHRKPKEFIDALRSIELLKPNHILSRSGKTGYMIFADYSVTFPLRNEKGKVVNFYAIQIRRENEIHSMLNDNGIYPNYPHALTRRLIICTDIIDTATIIESKVLENRESVMFLPEGKPLEQHIKAIRQLTDLQEIRLIENYTNPISQHWKGVGK